LFLKVTIITLSAPTVNAVVYECSGNRGNPETSVFIIRGNV